MSGLLSLLLFAVFFYFMMRFGCGAHMVHGHGGHEGHDGHGSGTGERVDSSNSEGSGLWHGGSTRRRIRQDAPRAPVPVL